MSRPQQDFIRVDYPNPHLKRMREILAIHPEVREFFGNDPRTAIYAVGLVLLQLAMAVWMVHVPWWVMLIAAYVIGATANHALFVIIHECTHKLVFKSPTANRLLAIFANFPQFFPSAMPFFKYHMLHHTNQAEYDFDADLAGMVEARLIKNSPVRKALLLFWFSMVQGLLRPARLKKVNFYDAWFFLNFAVQGIFLGLLFYFSGWGALIYLLLSTLFGIGLHPMGGRWIQEHYVLQGSNQETYSYYGLLNKLCFNMGYHNEHHDFMKVPWSKLRKLRATAPEYYDNLLYYKSWTWVLWKFIFDPEITLFNRVVRPSRNSQASTESEEFFAELLRVAVH